jgi:hypothetical protein
MAKQNVPGPRIVPDLDDEWRPVRIQMADHLDQPLIPSGRGEEVVGDHHEQIPLR